MSTDPVTLAYAAYRDPTARVVYGTALTIASAGTASPLAAAGLFAAGSAISYSGQKQLAADALREAQRKARARRDNQTIISNVAGGAEHIMQVWGKRRVGGLIAHARQDSTDTNVIHLAIVHSICHAGGCEGIDGLYINNDFISTSDMSGDPNTGEVNVTLAKFVAGGSNYMVKLRHYRGTDTQSADSVLTATGGGSSTDYRRKLAWTRVTLTRFPSATDDDVFQRAFPGGQIPVIGVRLKGIRVYDPRLDSTNGGSGSHRYSDPTTWAWTASSVDIGQNPILQLATNAIMLEDDGGFALDPATEVDWAYVAAEASKCEESISIPGPSTQRRFMGNTVLFPEEDGRENALKLLAPCAGDAVEELTTGKLRMFAGSYRSPTAEIDETWLRGSGERLDPRYPLGDIWNAVRVMHDSESQNYLQVEAAGFTDAAYEAEDDGERVWKELTVPGATNPYTAQYLGYIEGRKSRASFLRLPCNLKALGVTCGDTVTVKLKRMVDGEVYRIIQKTRDAGGTALVMRREESSYYDVPTFGTPVGTAAAPAPTAVAPPTPTGVTATAADGGVMLRWTGPYGTRAQRIEIHRSTTSGGTFTKIDEAIGLYYLDQTADNATYYYKLRAVTEFGEPSAFSSEVNNKTGSVRIAGSGARLADERNGTQLQGGNVYPSIRTSTTHPLTAADAGATATITIAAHTNQYGFGQRSYNSGSITGLSFNKKYYVYADDPTFAGGAVTYVAVLGTNNGDAPSDAPVSIAASSGRYQVGSITTPTDGGVGTGGGGGPDPCVAAESWLTESLRARDVRPGDVLDCMDEDGDFLQFPVRSVDALIEQPCRRIELEGGAAVTVSVTTPLTLEDGRMIRVPELIPGMRLAADYAGQRRWEPVRKVEDAGLRLVQHIHVAGLSYAAGELPTARVLTHNPSKP